MILDNIKITGDLVIGVYGPDNQIKDERIINNLVVTSGRNLIAKLLASTGSAPTHIALGTGNVPAMDDDTTLGAETGTRVVFNSATQEDNVVTYITSILPGTNTGSFNEAGIFNAPTGGTMLSRTTFNTIVKTSIDKLIITWKIRVN